MAASSRDWDELAEHYATTDTSAELADAERQDETPSAAMVTVSLRLPRATMDEVRHQAHDRGVRPTQLLREFVEAGLAEAGTDRAVVSVSDVVRAVRQAAAKDTRSSRESDGP